MEEKTIPIVWRVAFGAMFRVRKGGKLQLMFSLRNNECKWSKPVEYVDPHYDTMGVDQVSFVRVNERGEDVIFKDLFTITIDHGGDSTTVAKAVATGGFEKIVEKAFKAWLKTTGPILLQSGAPTYLDPTLLTGRYDTKDLPLLRKAFAHEMAEDMMGRKTDEEMYTKAVDAFNAFIDKVDEAQGDEVYWFESWAPLASRAGYVIIRNGRAIASKLMLMS